MKPIMDHPFPKSTTVSERCKRLGEVVSPDDTLAVLINADPDSLASALALKRFFWRKVRRTAIYRINAVTRADNLALVKLLKIDHQHIRHLNSTEITKWAIVDSQPHHDEQFRRHAFDIIIDHHPVGPEHAAQLVDIREDYGATSTIMTEYLRAAGIKPSPRLATALFYGIKTDTNNFVRSVLPNDINAFRYLYRYANTNIIKKIETSEITKKTLSSFRVAMENLNFYKDMAVIHMGKVSNPDILVIIADFFLKLAEASWCITSGIYGQKLIIIFRNVGFRRDAGTMAKKLFGMWGNAGGHKTAARAEIPLQKIKKDFKGAPDLGLFVISRLKASRRGVAK
jgi:nanoRNase/pAp phosphatase (c-di-AMP/oligoRNAs hydrolase)